MGFREMRGGDGVSDVEIRRNEIIELLYDDILTARIIEKVIVHSRQEIEIYFIGGYTQKIDLI